MKYFIQIGGHGTPWLKEFARYYANSKMRRFYDTIVNVVESEIPKFETFQDFYSNFQLRKWLEDPQSIPDEVYLSRAPIAMPMIQATQLAHFESIRISEVSSTKLLESTIAITGHSQGLVTATLIALGLEGDEYYKALEDYTRYLMHLSYQAQRIHPNIYSTPSENKKSSLLGSKNPEPMVAVLGSQHSNIENLVDKLNKSLDDEEQIYISLYNSPTNRILSGIRPSLIKFNQLIQDQIEAKAIKYVYLRSSSPFHSPCMKNIFSIFCDLLPSLHFAYRGSDLKIPVYSFSDGRNMQKDGDLGELLCKELMNNILNWNLAIRPLIKTDDADAVIDLGLGKVTHRLTDEILKTHGKELKFYVLSNLKFQDELIQILK